MCWSETASLCCHYISSSGENSLSCNASARDTQVAFSLSRAKSRKAVSWVLHQLRGFSDRESGGASRYFFSSSSALVLADLRTTLTSVNVLPNSVTSAEGLLFGAGPPSGSGCGVSDLSSSSSSYEFI